MGRPCTCDRLPPAREPYQNRYCRRCWLWHNDDRYRASWGEGGAAAAPSAAGNCFHLGTILSRESCRCPRKFVYACELHGSCRPLDRYGACPDYQPEG